MRSKNAQDGECKQASFTTSRLLLKRNTSISVLCFKNFHSFPHFQWVLFLTHFYYITYQKFLQEKKMHILFKIFGMALGKDCFYHTILYTIDIIYNNIKMYAKQHPLFFSFLTHLKCHL